MHDEIFHFEIFKNFMIPDKSLGSSIKQAPLQSMPVVPDATDTERSGKRSREGKKSEERSRVIGEKDRVGKNERSAEPVVAERERSDERTEFAAYGQGHREFPFGNSRESAIPKIPGGNSRELLSSR